MKKKLLISIMAIFMVCQGLLAGQADVFKYNKQQVQDEFSDLNQLEQTVIDHSFLTLSEMQSKNLLTEKFNTMNFTSMMDPALGIPGFWWGCVLGPIGILIAYLVSDNDKAEAKKALIGCIVGYGTMAVIYVVIYAIAYSSYSGY
jgi:hypothetical protein